MTTRPYALRSAFTLIELLIAISIIALLAALLLPAISKVRSYANRTTATSEITQLNSACVKFQGDWGFYPPSSFTVPTRIDQPGYVLLKSKYTRWSPTLLPDNATIAPASALANAGQTLNGNQSLVYFMQGPTRAPWQNAAIYAEYAGWASDGPYAPSLTATSPTSYFSFQTSKLVGGSSLGFVSNASVYMDPFGSPYAYFGSEKIGGKYLPFSMTFNGTTTFPIRESATKFVNEKTCQIISAGETGSDGLDGSPAYSRGFGIGGIWNPGVGDYASSGNGGDDFGNFNGGAPLNRSGN